jgi:hypothetical protein
MDEIELDQDMYRISGPASELFLHSSQWMKESSSTDRQTGRSPFIPMRPTIEHRQTRPLLSNPSRSIFKVGKTLSADNFKPLALKERVLEHRQDLSAMPSNSSPQTQTDRASLFLPSNSIFTEAQTLSADDLEQAQVATLEERFVHCLTCL